MKTALQYPYHLNSLQTLIAQKDEKYSLTDLGQEAYNLIVKTNAYTSTNTVANYLRKQLSLLIIANAILWAAAILASTEFEGCVTQLTSFAFIALWSISNILIYTILRRTSKAKTCPTKLW